MQLRTLHLRSEIFLRVRLVRIQLEEELRAQLARLVLTPMMALRNVRHVLQALSVVVRELRLAQFAQLDPPLVLALKHALLVPRELTLRQARPLVPLVLQEPIQAAAHRHAQHVHLASSRERLDLLRVPPALPVPMPLRVLRAAPRVRPEPILVEPLGHV